MSTFLKVFVTRFVTRFWFNTQNDSQEVASVVSAQEIRVVAELLQISPEGLQKSITFKVTVGQGFLTLLKSQAHLNSLTAVSHCSLSLSLSLSLSRRAWFKKQPGPRQCGPRCQAAS